MTIPSTDIITNDNIKKHEINDSIDQTIITMH